MDKETLSHYGWVVIITLILAVLLALATPFGNYVGDAVVNVANGFVGASNEAIDEDNIKDKEQDWHNKLNNIVPRVPAVCSIEGHYEDDGKIHGIPTDCGNHTYTCECSTWVVPTGGTYKRGDVTYNAGNTVNCIKDGDTYAYSDYLYTYYTNKLMTTIGAYKNQEVNGWDVKLNLDVTDKNRSTYDTVLSNINNQPVTMMSYTFSQCKKLTNAPVAPETVLYLDGTYMYCPSLAVAPSLPSNLVFANGLFEGNTALKTYVGNTDGDGNFSGYVIPENTIILDYLFRECTAMVTPPTIPQNVESMWQTFYGCTSLQVVPIIPEKVVRLNNAFYNCSGLKWKTVSVPCTADISGHTSSDKPNFEIYHSSKCICE